MKHKEHSILIKNIGGTVETAKICEVSSQAVSKWKRCGIPRARLLFLREKFPELFSKKDSSEEAA